MRKVLICLAFTLVGVVAVAPSAMARDIDGDGIDDGIVGTYTAPNKNYSSTTNEDVRSIGEDTDPSDGVVIEDQPINMGDLPLPDPEDDPCASWRAWVDSYQIMYDAAATAANNAWSHFSSALWASSLTKSGGLYAIYKEAAHERDGMLAALNYYKAKLDDCLEAAA